MACGLALDDAGFDPSTLVYWRRRLAASGRPHRINDAVRKVIEETGVLTGRRRRAVDSTILADAVATQDTITQLVAAVRRVARVVPGAAELVAAVCTGHDYSQPGKPKIDWDDPQAKDALVPALVNDANALVMALAGAELDETGASAVALLALVAGQDVEPAEGSDGTDGRWRIARKVSPDRVISTVDTEARHTRKSPENRRDGYRAHVAAEPGTGLITDEELTMAAGAGNSDAALAARFLAAEGQPARAYGDSAYSTGELRAALKEAGHAAVIKPKPLKPAVEGGFTLDDFTVDETAGAVTCPAGVTRRISARRNVTFGAACRGCPLDLGGQGLVGGEKLAHPRIGVAALPPREVSAEIFNMDLDPRPVTGEVGHGHAPLLPDHSGLAAVGGQRDLDGLILRLVRFPVQHQQPPRGLAGFHPPCAFPSAGKNPLAILAARSQVSLNLAPPAGQTRGIGER